MISICLESLKNLGLSNLNKLADKAEYKIKVLSKVSVNTSAVQFVLFFFLSFKGYGV